MFDATFVYLNNIYKASHRPQPEPVAVIQRPWIQRDWLDTESRCWMFSSGTSTDVPSWELVHVSELEERCNTETLWNTESSPMRTAGKRSWCLPHWAIAIPQGDHFRGATKMVGDQQGGQS
jgi:hypothetical protein